MGRALLVSLCALLALLAWRDDVPDVEIRYTPRQTQAGRIFPGHALGQGFVCEFDGLHALDVALAPIGGERTAIDFELRVGAPDGPLLRRARLEAAALPERDDWARFEFEPLPDSAGQRFYFALSSAAPSGHSPWVRYRGVPYLVRPWGDRVIAGTLVEGELLPAPPRPRTDLHHADLRALAFAVDGVDAAAGPAVLTLSDPSSGAVLRSATLRPAAPHATGWMFFEFETLANTRWRALHYRLDLPPGARLVGSAEGPSMVAFHGSPAVPSAVLGATWRTEQLSDRDLVFRAWSSETRSALLAKLSERGGLRLLFAAGAWFLALVVAGRLLRRSDEAGA